MNFIVTSFDLKQTSLSLIILIIASSGRMLAEAASHCGIHTVVVDLYADADTEKFSGYLLQIASLSITHIAPVFDILITQFSLHGVVYGSGLERHPETLTYLSERLAILGNSAEVFTTLLDKPTFFRKLDVLRIPYPEVLFNAPTATQGWLVKSMRGSGGSGIRWYDGFSEITAFEYWQKYQPGMQYSLLLIANGVSFVIIGFHRQWTLVLDSQPFIFSGIGPCQDLELAVQQEVSRWAEVLVSEYALKGLNSLDFIESQGKLSLLEINPRPSASMQLYDDELLSMHVQACAGKLPSKINLPSDYRCYQLVYAKQQVKIPEHFTWPEVCRDLSKPGTVIEKGQPICSILAVDADTARTKRKIDAIRQSIEDQLAQDRDNV